MTQPLAAQISQVNGLPSSVRIGVIASLDPLVVSVQGALFSSASVGVVQPGIPAVGSPAVLLGQAGLSGGDPTSWLLLGSVGQATAPSAVVSFSAVSGVSTTSTTFVSTSTIVEVSFVAPGSGAVIVMWRGYVFASGGSPAVLAPETRLGEDFVTGIVFEAATDGVSISASSGIADRRGSSHHVTGLTAGLTYTVRLMQRSASGASTANFGDREIIVLPV